MYRKMNGNNIINKSLEKEKASENNFSHVLKEKVETNSVKLTSKQNCISDDLNNHKNKNDSNKKNESTNEFEKSLNNEKSDKIHLEVIRINQQQKKILEESYKNCLEKNSHQNGLKLFIKLISEHPEYKKIWPQFRHIPDSALLNAKELHNHIIVYMKSILFIINSLNDEKKLTETLQKISQAHTRKNIYKKHIMDMLTPLLEIFEETKNLTDETKEAWTTLFDVISNLILILQS